MRTRDSSQVPLSLKSMFHLFTPLFIPLLPFADSVCKTWILTREQTLAICLNSLLSLMRKIVPKNCYALGFESESTALPIPSSMIPMYVLHDFEVCSVRDSFLRLYGMQFFSSRNENEKLNRPGLEHKR